MGRYLYQPDPIQLKDSKHICKLGKADRSSPRFERYTQERPGTVWLCECGKLWVVKQIIFDFDSVYPNIWKRMWIKSHHIVDQLDQDL